MWPAEVECPAGFQYYECGSNCRVTCQDVIVNSTCHEECVDGCACASVSTTRTTFSVGSQVDAVQDQSVSVGLN